MSIESKWDGTCSKNKEHTWKKGQQIYYSKDQKATCILKTCFEEQLKAAQPTPASAKAETITTKSVSIEGHLAYAKAFDDWAWNLSKQHALELLPKIETGPDKSESLEMQNKRAIAVESIYHTLVEAYNGAA